MPQKCSICIHPKRDDIERAVVQGQSLRKIVSRFKNCSTASVSRHTKRCIANAIQQVRSAREQVLDEKVKRSVEVLHDHVAEQARVTLQTAVTIESELARLIERMGKLFDACDAYLTDPSDPGTYTIDPRSSEVRIVWEELEETDGKPKWVKKAGKLQEALDLAFSNGHRRYIGPAIVSHADARKLILDTATQISRHIEIMAKLEGRYSAPAPLSDGNTVQLVWIQQVLVQNGVLRA